MSPYHKGDVCIFQFFLFGETMEPKHPEELDWTATLRRRDTNKDHCVNVRGVDVMAAAAEAKMKADDRFSIVVRVEVLE